MRTAHRSDRADRRGTNMVEFALTLPIFLFILFGLFDYGWFFLNKAMADIAVTRGCRAGAITDTLDGDPAEEAEEVMVDWMDLVVDGCQGGCSAAVSGDVPTRIIQCTVVVPHAAMVGLMPVPEVVRSETIARLEWQRRD